MKKSIVIAESGGTKTDWVLVQDGERLESFTTESYHPDYLSKEFETRTFDFWSGKENWTSSDIYFFGSGCLRKDKSNLIRSLLEKIFKGKSNVYSDLHAAGFAAWGDGSGAVAILGTGSVFFTWKNKSVDQIIGGKGFKSGDEGSGFYFGKLIYDKFQSGQLNELQRSIVMNELDIDLLTAAYYMEDYKFQFAEIASKLSAYKEHFTDVHVQNIEAFYSAHLASMTPAKLTIVGSYGYYNADIIQTYLSDRNWEVSAFIERPMDGLIERMGYFID